MRFRDKPIEIGTVIYCKNETELEALTEHLESLGYTWRSSLSADLRVFGWLKDLCNRYTGVCIHVLENKEVTWGTKGYYKWTLRKITNFQELIESDEDKSAARQTESAMSEIKALTWLKNYDGRPEMEEVFGCIFCSTAIQLDLKEIISGIAAFEAKKEPEMTREKAVKIIQNERECVKRRMTGCRRDCANCDLLTKDADIIVAYDYILVELTKEEVTR